MLKHQATKTLILLLLRSQPHLWGSPSSSAFPAVSLDFTFFFFCVPSCISGLHLLLLLRSQLYLWASPSSSSAFPAVSLGFTFFSFFCVLRYISGVHLLLFLLRSQLYFWGSPSPSSSSSVFPAISLGFTIFGEIFAYLIVF